MTSRSRSTRFEESGCQILGVIVNRADCPKLMTICWRRWKRNCRDNHTAPVGDPRADHAEQPDGERDRRAPHGRRVIYGGETAGQAGLHYLVIAMHIANYLPHLRRQRAADHAGRPQRCHPQRPAGAPIAVDYPPRLPASCSPAGLNRPIPSIRLLDRSGDSCPSCRSRQIRTRRRPHIADVRSYITPDAQAKIRLSLRLVRSPCRRHRRPGEAAREFAR